MPVRLQEAKEHDDRYAAADAIGRPSILWLARHDVTQARQALSEIRQPEAQHQLDWPDYLRLFAETQVDLYAGEPGQAWIRIEAGSWSLQRMTIRLVQSTRIEAVHLRARAALAAARDVASDSRMLDEANRAVRRLRREGVAWADALADLVAAGVASHTSAASASELARRACDRFESCGLQLYAAAARRRYGELIGGDHGREAVMAADARMAQQGIASPARMTAMLAPGFCDAGRDGFAHEGLVAPRQRG